jgi:hypothetical protein
MVAARALVLPSLSLGMAFAVLPTLMSSPPPCGTVHRTPAEMCCGWAGLDLGQFSGDPSRDLVCACAFALKLDCGLCKASDAPFHS